jgi:hypothetical protein
MNTRSFATVIAEYRGRWVLLDFWAQKQNSASGSP